MHGFVFVFMFTLQKKYKSILMKRNANYNLLGLLFLATVLVFVSCGKDIETDPDNPGPDETAEWLMNATIDGEEWIATDHFRAPTAKVYNNLIKIEGTTIQSDILLILYGTDEGNYSLNPEQGNHLTYICCGFDTKFLSSNQNQTNTNFGAAMVSEINWDNMTMSGSFESEAHLYSNSDVHVITSGKFENILIEDYRGEKGMMFDATVDGKNFRGIPRIFNSDQTMFVSADDGSTREGLTLTFPTDLEPGTYQFQDTGDFRALYDPMFISSPYMSGSGTLTIEEHDLTNKFIKGTFDYDAVDHNDEVMNSISSGSFQGTYE